MARGSTSEATTRVLCAAACTACTPGSVPRSKAASIGRRIVAPARAAGEALIPSTWPSVIGADGPGRSWATSRSSGSPSGPITTTPRAAFPVDGDQPAGQPVLEGQRGERRTAAVTSTASPTRNRRASTSSLFRRGRPHQRSDLSRGRGWATNWGSEALGDRLQRVAGKRRRAGREDAERRRPG